MGEIYCLVNMLTSLADGFYWRFNDQMEKKLTDKILVTRSSLPPFDEYINEIASLWESHWLTNCGEKHQKFESELVRFLGVPYISLFTNGHSALEYALEVLGLQGEVITTPFTFASTTNAIVRKGLKPVFADISANDYTIDPSCIEPLINERTCAILPVHVYGNICDVDAIDEIAKKYNLKVIYDAAHAFDVKKNNESIAKYGDITMFSFHATKVFNTIEGGALCCKEKEIKIQLEQRKNFGITGPENVGFVGGNAKMNEFSAAMGLCSLRHLDEEISKRKMVVERYRENLCDVEGLKINFPQQDIQENYAYMPVLFEDSFGSTRNEVVERLNKNKVYPRKYFYPLVSDFDCYKRAYSSCEIPVARYVSERILTLPLYADLPLDKVDFICSIIKDCRVGA